MVELHPAYCFNCTRCKQPIYLNVTTLAYQGQRNFVLGHDINSSHAGKIYEIDLAVWDLRMQGVNATPPGMNIQLLPDTINCDACNAEYNVAKIIGNLGDAGAFNCEKCWCEQHVPFEVLEENTTALTLVAHELVRGVQSGISNLESLMMLVAARILVAGETMHAIDRISLAPDKVTCIYCGIESQTKLLEPSPLIKA